MKNSNLMGYNYYYPFGLQMPRRTYNGGLTNNLYKYSSKELDEENNLSWYYYGARFYDPGVGRWPVTDPIAQSFSPYSFVGNNPMIFVDPDGRLFGGLLGFLGGLVNDFFGALSRSNQPGLSFSIGGPSIITDISIPFGLASENVPGLRLPRRGPCLPGLGGNCTGGLTAQIIERGVRGFPESAFLGPVGGPSSSPIYGYYSLAGAVYGSGSVVANALEGGRFISDRLGLVNINRGPRRPVSALPRRLRLPTQANIRFFRLVGRTGFGLSTALLGIDLYDAYLTGSQYRATLAAGRFTGSLVGGFAGGFFGSFATPLVGTAAGALAGSYAGSALGERFVNQFFLPNERY